jgi:hypothetical protein
MDSVQNNIRIIKELVDHHYLQEAASSKDGVSWTFGIVGSRVQILLWAWLYVSVMCCTFLLLTKRRSSVQTTKCLSIHTVAINSKSDMPENFIRDE